MNNWKKNTRPGNRFLPQGRFLTYAVALFLVYLVYTIEQDKREEQSLQHPQEKNETKPATQTSGMPMENQIATLLSKAGLEFKDRKPGKGLPVLCGETVTIAYESYLPSGKAFGKIGPDAPRTVQVGSGEIIPGLELGLLGMRKGGLRRLAIPAPLAHDDPAFGNPKIPPGTSIGMQVYVIGKQFEAPEEDTLPLKFYEDKPGDGPPALCGDAVTIRYDLYNTAGYHVAPLPAAGEKMDPSFIAGGNEAPAILSHAALGMRKSGQRTVIIPSVFFEKEKMKSFFKREVPEAQVLILELELLKHPQRPHEGGTSNDKPRSP